MASKSAFPTLSPTASTIRKSFFDATGSATISGQALVSVYPLTERKGRARNFFVTVHLTLLEMHKTQKDARNKKAAKHLIDFGDVFNVSLQNEPIQIKDDCICIMDPNSSFFIKPIDTDYDLQAWFDWILERSRECRSTKLLRPVFREEYFEAAWDVQIIRRPKLRRDYSKKQAVEALPDDLAEKRPQMLGHRRLCICPSSFLIFSIGCRPTSSVDAPFDKNTFIDLSLNVISNYGTQERFFFIRIGRCSEIGSGELWMATEHGSMARVMHEKIILINQRESERRRAQGIKINLPTISSSVLKSRAHRERSQTANMHKVGSRNRLTKSGDAEGNQNECESRKISANSSNKEADSKQFHSSTDNENSQLDARPHSGRVDSISCLQSIPERCLLSETNLNLSDANSSKKNSIVGMLASRIGAKMSAGSTGKQTAEVKDQLTAPCSPSAQSVGKSFVLEAKNTQNSGSNNASLANLMATSSQTPRNSLVNTMLGIRLARRNSLTNTNAVQNIVQKQPQEKQTAPCVASSSFSAQPSYDCAEDYMCYDADERMNERASGHSLKLGSIGSRVSACALTRAESRKSNSSYSGAAPMRQFSTSSGICLSSPDPISSNKVAAGFPNIPADYLEMNLDTCGTGQKSVNVFALHEVQSYISNSSESCWTPGSNNTTRSGELANATNAPRAYSLGSRPGQNKDNNNDSTATEMTRLENSSEQSRLPTILNSQLLHPSCNSSPPNYLKKTILCQTVKNIKCSGDITEERDGLKLEENKAIDIMEKELKENELAMELRKRAHSVGSKTWVKPTLRKFSTAIGASNKKKQDDDANAPMEEDNSRRNTYGAKSMGSSSTCYPHSMEDHVEIDFDRDESPSMDSIPSLHSRNSSLGIQCPVGIRSALDSLAQSRGFGSPSTQGKEKPPEKLAPSKGRGETQMKRKRSVPEMFQNFQQSQQQPVDNRKATMDVDQDKLLHPNRRSTCDSTTLRLKVGERKGIQQQQKPSPPKAKPQIPSSQSTSSGISSRLTESSTCERELRTTKDMMSETIVENEDDYVLLDTPCRQYGEKTSKNQSQQQQTIRSIGTILESSSPCSSFSSDGESKRRSRLTSHGNSPHNTAEFMDDYSPLVVNPTQTHQFRNRSIITTADSARSRLSVSTSKSRSPSQSPQRLQCNYILEAAQCSPGQVRSYFPIPANLMKQQLVEPKSPSSSARRKTSAVSCTREKLNKDQQDDKMARKFTCPNLASDITQMMPIKAENKGRRTKKNKSECDYALISGQDV